jgi:hypothetical protein
MFPGALIVAGLIGCVTGSWTICRIALAVQVIGSFYAGDIRP